MTSFWQHEWEKHGTCSLSLSEVANEKDYFTTTLNLRKEYNFDTILSKASITPDDNKPYKLNDIEEAIKKALKVEPIVSCYSQDNKQYIAEMQVCLDRNLELIECKSAQDKGHVAYSSEKPCSTKNEVYYPAIKGQRVIFNV